MEYDTIEFNLKDFEKLLKTTILKNPVVYRDGSLVYTNTQGLISEVLITGTLINSKKVIEETTSIKKVLDKIIELLKSIMFISNVKEQFEELERNLNTGIANFENNSSEFLKLTIKRIEKLEKQRTFSPCPQCGHRIVFKKKEEDERSIQLTFTCSFAGSKHYTFTDNIWKKPELFEDD